MYGRIVNDALEYAPSVFISSDGCRIINFNKSISLMKQYGFLEIENVVPMYDKNTEIVNISGYEVKNNKIIVKYVIVEKPYEGPSIEERISNIESVLAEQASIFDDEINK